MSFFEIIAQLGDSMLRTLAIFLLTLVFSIPLGMIVCVMRMYGWKPLQWLARIYISVLRGTPLMLQLLVVYFGPYFIFQIPLSTSYRFYAVIIAFSLNYAAYFAEIFRSGIQSIPVGQYEASRILGYNRVQMFLRIILPQVIKRILPAVTNETITLVKDTSLAFVLGMAEMFSVAKALAASNVSMIPYAIAALIYWVFCLFIEFILGRVEKKLAYYHD